MNLLERFVSKNDLDQIEVMNQLQDSGVVIDNAVHVEDVAESDCLRAVIWLRNRMDANDT